MRYVIGVKIPDSKENGEYKTLEGLYLMGSFGFPWILGFDKFSNEIKDNERNIYVFNSIDDVNAYISECRKSYKKEFKDRAYKNGFKYSDYKFFPLKFDSSKFKCIKLRKKIKESNNKCLYEFDICFD